MQLQQSLITAVRQQQNLKNNGPNRQLEQLEIVNGSLRLSRTENLLCVNVNDDLVFYRVSAFSCPKLSPTPESAIWA